MSKGRRLKRLSQGELVCTETGEVFNILDDKKVKSKNAPEDQPKRCAFGYRKKQAGVVAGAFATFGEKSISRHIAGCGNRLYFDKCRSGDYQRLTKAFFCKKRMCPMCQWRRSLKTFTEVASIAEKHFEQRKSDKAVLLTLTVPNCSSDNLKDTLASMSKAFNNLMRRDEILGLCTAWFRTTEVTYNTDRRDYHPHFHILLMFSKRDHDLWFDKRQQKNGKVIVSQLHKSQAHVAKRWTELNDYDLPNDMDLVCHIRRINNCDLKTVAEVAKYATKPSDYIQENEEGQFIAFSDVVEALHYGLFRKRLIAYGKNFKDIRKDLQLEDDEEKQDLVNVTNEASHTCCPHCGNELEQHEFLFKMGFYVKD